MAQSFVADGVAVITGGASGIGRAAARRAAQAGMRIVLIDVNEAKLAATAAELAGVVGTDNVWAEVLSVADPAAMAGLAQLVEIGWGAPSVLMNNAAFFVSGGAGGILDPIENWAKTLAVNVIGPVNGVQAFLPGMLKANRRSVIVNTGSKQGLTNPPGNPAYNTSKAAVNAYTQNLARDLREREGGQVSAHLLIPGWTTTGEAEHRAGAWLPEQVVDYMAAAIGRDEFFILCPDDETPNETDHKRILWNAMDIIENRPALSRWHPDWKDAFAEFMGRDLPKV
jgi:NAD(P)-dependent dehydrogenase (short-subunit alcohol dehydrogenase family)